MKKNFAVQLIAINVYAFAISFMWNSLHPLVMPFLIARLEPDFKNTFLGLITAAGLVVATVVQPLAGGLSDRSRSRWGRRRPYILGGTMFDLVFLAMIAVSGSSWLLLISYCLLQTSSNVAHGPYQGLIPDLIPANKKGIASGVKNLVELIALCAGVIRHRHVTRRRTGRSGSPCDGSGPAGNDADHLALCQRGAGDY